MQKNAKEMWRSPTVGIMRRIPVPKKEGRLIPAGRSGTAEYHVQLFQCPHATHSFLRALFANTSDTDCFIFFNPFPLATTLSSPFVSR